MEHITKEFTYNLPDELYSQTREKNLKGTLTYTGPAKKYAVVEVETNKLTGATITEDLHETYNDTNDEFYSVEIDCETNPLLCSILDNHIDPDAIPNKQEILPDGTVFETDDPAIPYMTYDLYEIEFDRVSQSFKTPYPWKRPEETWDQMLHVRQRSLEVADRQLSEDLPESLYNAMVEYKQYLRDLPETYGANWTVTVTEAGTGFSAGDRILISDPVYKNNSAVSDIILTVTEVNDSGAIVNFTKSNTKAFDYHTDEATYTDVYFTTNGGGSGAEITLSKIKTVGPWKITLRDSPLG